MRPSSLTVMSSRPSEPRHRPCGPSWLASLSCDHAPERDALHVNPSDLGAGLNRPAPAAEGLHIEATRTREATWGERTATTSTSRHRRTPFGRARSQPVASTLLTRGRSLSIPERTAVLAVASGPWRGGVRVWEITSGGRGQGPGRRCRRAFVRASVASAIACAFAAGARRDARLGPCLEFAAKG